MKNIKFALLSILLFFNFNLLYSQDSVKINLIVYADTISETQQPKVFNKLFFGFHKDATDGLDFALGEEDLPPLIPPGMLYAHFIIRDSISGDDSLTDHFSYIDYKNFPEDGYYKEYFFKVYNNSRTIGLKWGILPEEIERAILNDNLIGNIIEVDMKKDTGFFSTNPAFNSFKIKLWYKSNSNTIEYKENETKRICIYPNPFSNIINVFFQNELNESYYYKIYSIKGELLNEGKILGNELKVQHLNRGIYLLNVYNLNGFNYIEKIIKID